jgi:S1-C subfamily serine protease
MLSPRDRRMTLDKDPAMTRPPMPAAHRAALSVPLLLLLAARLAPAGAAADEAPPLREVFARVDLAVVEIRTMETDVPPPPGMAQPASLQSLGSGVMITKEGRILTAAHVVQTADQIEVRLQSGETIAAHVLSSEPLVDLALLLLDRPPRTPFIAPLGDSDAMAVGDRIFVVGAPLGVSHTLTVGYISGRRKPGSTVSGMAPVEFFQTDAAINQGNSGGPMFNLQGEVVGIVSYILSRSGGSQGLGFAVTSKVARLLLDKRAFWTGIDGYLLDGDLAQVLNLPAPGAGLLVQRVAKGSPAEKLGLKAGTIRAHIGDEDLIVGGDIVLAVQDIPMTGPESLAKVRARILSMAPGDGVNVTVLRGGKKIALAGTVPAGSEKP